MTREWLDTPGAEPTYHVLPASRARMNTHPSLSATCGASSPLVMILAIRLHFLLLVALWIIFFLSSSPTDTYWKP